MTPLTKERFDQMRCHHHGGDPQPVYMHGRCHVRAKNKVSLDEDILSVSCSVCNSMIVEALIVKNESFNQATQGAMSCAGHCGNGLWTLYLEGDLYIICAGCDQPLTILEVKKP
jgi:hypothetical protein